MTKQDAAAPAGDERVAFTLRLDASLISAVELEREELAGRLGVGVSKNEFYERVVRFYLAHGETARAWMPTATNGNGKKGRG
jgi:hypothetical protein